MLDIIRDNIKNRLVEMYKIANAGHVGSSLSCLEVVTFIKFGLMQADDEFILSKGHAAALLYSSLAEEGILSNIDIATFYQNGTNLPAHPPVNSINGIPFATGSLGHGLSLATGLALANKLKKNSKKIFCLTSDGELNEGSTWEAALFLAHHNLQNVVWFIDRNQLQGFGRTEDTLRLNPLDKKLESFGFQVIIADGHNFDSLRESISKFEHKKPLAIICNTIKGRGMQLENTVDCHYLPLNNIEYLNLTSK